MSLLVIDNDRVERFERMLLDRNATLNLTAARDAEAVREHVRDSLTLSPYVRTPLVDVGSGGGFPGIVLALAIGGPVTLIESVAKKARFLADVVAALDLQVDVLAERAEDVGRRGPERGSFAAATARAVGSLTTVLELTLPLLRVGGVAVLQRGGVSDAERSAAADAALVLGGRLVSEHFISAADAEEPDLRRILLVEKVAQTGGRFPRRAGIPAKRPLCWQGSGG